MNLFKKIKYFKKYLKDCALLDLKIIYLFRDKRVNLIETAQIFVILLTKIMIS